MHTLVFRSLKRTHDMFLSDQGFLPPVCEEAERLKKLVKAKDQYGPLLDIVSKRKRELASEGITDTYSVNEKEAAQLALTDGTSKDTSLALIG